MDFIKLHHYIFLFFILVTFLMASNKGTYSAASYNAITGEVVEYQQDLPEHIYIHENVHKRLWWETLLLFIVCMFVLIGFSFGLNMTKQAHLFYILISAHSEITAYLLTPITNTGKGIYISVILLLAVVNWRFWKYFFYETDIKKPLKEATKRDLILPPFMVLFFWLI